MNEPAPYSMMTKDQRWDLFVKQTLARELIRSLNSVGLDDPELKEKLNSSAFNRLSIDLEDLKNTFILYIPV